MPNPNAQSALKIVTQEAFDPALLAQVLSEAAQNPVTVDNGTVNFDESDRGAVEATLATIGIEVSPADAPIVQATDAPIVQATDAPIVQATDAPAAPADALDVVEAKLTAAKSWQGVLCNANTLEASWLLVAGDSPVARIRLAAIKGSAQLASLFSTAKYFESLQASFTKNGVKATLSTVNAEVVTDELAAPPAPVDVEGIKASVLANFRKCLSVALLSAQNNVSVNRLKAGAFKVLSELKVDNPEAVVEAIFAESEGFMDDVISEAEALDQETPEAFQATVRTLTKMGVQAAANRKPVSQTALDMRASLTQGNNPLTSAVGDPLRNPEQEWEQHSDPVGVIDPVTPEPLVASAARPQTQLTAAHHLFAAALPQRY